MSELSKNNEILKDNELDEVSGGVKRLTFLASENDQSDDSGKAPRAMRRAQPRSRLPFKLAALKDDDKAALAKSKNLRSKKCI